MAFSCENEQWQGQKGRHGVTVFIVYETARCGTADTRSGSMIGLVSGFLGKILRRDGLADQYGGRGLRSEGVEGHVLSSASAGTDQKIELEVRRAVEGIIELSDAR